MTTKLTLSVDSRLISSAKKYSKRKGTSLSKLFEDYLRHTLRTEDKLRSESSVKELKGILGKTSADFDYKAELEKILDEKYK